MTVEISYENEWSFIDCERIDHFHFNFFVIYSLQIVDGMTTQSLKLQHIFPTTEFEMSK